MPPHSFKPTTQQDGHKLDLTNESWHKNLSAPTALPFLPSTLDESSLKVVFDETGLARDLALQHEAARRGYLNRQINRFKEVLIDLDGVPGVPQQWVLLTEHRLKEISPFINSPRTAAYLAFQEGEGALTDFRPDALNVYNSVYYSSQHAFDQVPNLFTENESVSDAFAGYLEREVSCDSPRYLELCAGLNSLSRWRHLFERTRGAKKISLTLADATLTNASNVEGHDTVQSISIETRNFDLLKAPHDFFSGQKFDRIVICYGVDSAWWPGDLHLIKNQGNWFQALMRVSVPDWHPHRDEVIRAFENNDGSQLRANDFDFLAIERAVVPYDCSQLPFLDEVCNLRYKGESQATVVYPLGLASWIHDVMKELCSTDGKLLIGDTGVYRAGNEYFYGLIETQCGAQARLIDFELLSLLLTQSGLQTRIWQISDFIAEYGSKSLPANSSHLDPQLHSSQFVFEVANASSSHT